MAVKIAAAWVEVVRDDDPDASYLEQTDPDFSERLAAYRAGDFSFVGVRAAAEIHIPQEEGWISQTVTSPGLWGIEDDSGEDYLRSVGAEEATTLGEILRAMGVDSLGFDLASVPGELRYG